MFNKKSFYIIVIGCQMNKSDAEKIAAYLGALGYRETADKYRAGLVILVTCGIRQSAEDRVYGFIPAIRKENPDCKIMLTGCLSERADVLKRVEENVDLVLNINDLPKLAEKLGIEMADEYEEDYLKISPKRVGTISTFVPIGNGCDNFCSYCVVPYARGREVYRDVADILAEVKDIVKKGYKEITLIAQNVNSYRAKDSDGKVIDFADLLKLVNDVAGEFWLRFATSHPKDMSDKLIATFADCDKLCEHLHLPAQSGSNKILQAMNRKYSVEHYLELLEKVRQKVPEIEITTDIIVGFPGETVQDFAATSKLFELVRYDMAYVAQYSPRPGTASSKMEDDVSREDKRLREKKLMEILRRTALANSRKMLSKTVDVLVCGKNKKGELFGHTRTQKNVAFEGDDSLIGKIVRVQIKAVDSFGVRGAIN